MTEKIKKPLNRWQLHVKATQEANPNLKFSEVLKLAGKTYKK